MEGVGRDGRDGWLLGWTGQDGWMDGLPQAERCFTTTGGTRHSVISMAKERKIRCCPRRDIGLFHPTRPHVPSSRRFPSSNHSSSTSTSPRRQVFFLSFRIDSSPVIQKPFPRLPHAAEHETLDMFLRPRPIRPRLSSWKVWLTTSAPIDVFVADFSSNRGAPRQPGSMAEMESQGRGGGRRVS